MAFTVNCHVLANFSQNRPHKQATVSLRRWGLPRTGVSHLSLHFSVLSVTLAAASWKTAFTSQERLVTLVSRPRRNRALLKVEKFCHGGCNFEATDSSRSSVFCSFCNPSHHHHCHALTAFISYFNTIKRRPKWFLASVFLPTSCGSLREWPLLRSLSPPAPSVNVAAS